mgnify:CR=1 FL=1
MAKLIPIIVFSMILAFVADRSSGYSYDTRGIKQYTSKNRIFFVALVLVMAVFVGLRTSGNDTYTYQQMYERIPDGIDAIFSVDWTDLAAAPGHQFISGCLKYIGASTQDYFMFFALISVPVYLWFIRKYTCNLTLSVYFFITMGVYVFAMAAVKQTTAVALLMVASDRAFEKKYVQFVVWLLIAELFHPYAFVYLIVPFMSFIPWTWKTYVLLVGTAVVSMGLSRLMGGILAMTDVLGGDYSATEFLGEGVNIFRVLVVWVPVGLSFLARKYIRVNSDRISNYIINLTMVNAMVMFVGLFGTANYFARLANYFLIFQTLSLPLIFNYFTKQSKRLLIIVSVLCYFVFFYYENTIANGRFDEIYQFLSIYEYLGQLAGGIL